MAWIIADQECRQGAAPTGISTYLLVGHQDYKEISSATLELWGHLRKALVGDRSLLHLLISRMCDFLFRPLDWPSVLSNLQHNFFSILIPTTDICSRRDFPSLSGAPQQSQTPNPGLVWGQRALQQTPQRQQHPTSQAPSRAPQTQSHHPQQQSQPSHEDVFPSGAQFANRLDDFRNGGQGISGQLGGSGQPQTGNIDEFPPLGRNVAAELGQDRRESLMQSTGLGNFGGTMPFTGANQNQSANRTMIGGSINGQDTSRMMSPTNAGSTGMFIYFSPTANRVLIAFSAIGTSRSPVNQGANGVPGSEKEVRSLQLAPIHIPLLNSICRT